MTHDDSGDGTYRVFDRRTLLRATAVAGTVAFGAPALSGVASAGSIPDRLYWTGCRRVRADGLAEGEELGVLVFGPDGLSDEPVRATTRMDSRPPWGFEFDPEWGDQSVVGVRTSEGSYILNPASCATPYADAVREAYGADREIRPETEHVVERPGVDGDDGGDTEGPFERVARLRQGDPGWRSTFATATEIADGQVFVGFPDNTNPNGFRAGAVYVYERRGGEWTEVQKLLADAPGKTIRARFGDSLDVEDDRLVVGSAERVDQFGNDVGRLYVFERTDGEWRQTARLDPSEPMRYLTTSVAVAGDYAFFGAEFDEAEPTVVNPVSVFEYDGGSWSETEPVASGRPSPDLLFGLSLDFDGSRGVVGAPRQEIQAGEDLPGRAYVYRRDGGEWTQVTELMEPEESFGGFAIVVRLDGDHVFVGDPSGDGAVYHYTPDGGSWTQADVITPPDADIERFGADLAVDGETLLVGSDAGAHVFGFDGEAWTQTQFLDTRWPARGLSVDAALAAARDGENVLSVYER